MKLLQWLDLGEEFLFSDTEFQMMKSEILWFKENGADGIVLGLLNSDGTVDKGLLYLLS